MLRAEYRNDSAQTHRSNSDSFNDKHSTSAIVSPAPPSLLLPPLVLSPLIIQSTSNAFKCKHCTQKQWESFSDTCSLPRWVWASLRTCLPPPRELVLRPEDTWGGGGWWRAIKRLLFSCPFHFALVFCVCVITCRVEVILGQSLRGSVQQQQQCVTHNRHPLSPAEVVPLRKSCLSARTCYPVLTSASNTSNSSWASGRWKWHIDILKFLHSLVFGLFHYKWHLKYCRFQQGHVTPPSSNNMQICTHKEGSLSLALPASFELRVKPNERNPLAHAVPR